MQVTRRRYIRKSAGNVCNIDHDTGPQGEALEDLEVVAVAPLAAGAVAVVAVVCRDEELAGGVVKVGDGDDVLEGDELALGEAIIELFNAVDGDVTCQ